MQGFYREWVKERPYIVFSEGLLELYKTSYRTTQADEVRVLKGRRKPLPHYVVAGADTCRVPSVTNGPLLGVLPNVVKQKSQNTFLNPSGLSQYDYAYAGATRLYDRTLYVIGFKPRPESQQALFGGKLFIDQSTKAIVRAEYGLSVQGLGVVDADLSAQHIPIKIQQRYYVVECRLQNNRWYLQHAQAFNK